MIQQQFNVKEYIWQNMSDLPNDSLNEILNFVIYVRKKVYQPELFQLDNEGLHKLLIDKSRHEEKHVESEFENYKTFYPHE